MEETLKEKKMREIGQDLIQEEVDMESSIEDASGEAHKKTQAAEMWKRACETVGETQERSVM